MIRKTRKGGCPPLYIYNKNIIRKFSPYLVKLWQIQFKICCNYSDKARKSQKTLILVVFLTGNKIVIIETL